VERTVLDLREVSISFGGLKALHDVNLDVRQGDILGLIGPNGAGKTTLFNVINGFLQAEKGEIILDGEKIRGLKPFDICRRGIGRTFQLVKTFNNMTALENVVVGALLHTDNVGDARRRAEETLKLVGLIDKKDITAENLTLMERKRIELARALSTKPKLLLLDELLTGLNPSEMDDALQLIRDIRDRGATICMVEHVMRAVMSVCNRIVVLNFGKKIAEGSPKKVANDKKVIEAYLGEEVIAGSKEY